MSSQRKRFFLFSFSILLLITSLLACSEEKEQTDQPPAELRTEKKVAIKDQKFFGVESGIVEYKITGSQTGDKTLYFKDWGRKQAEFSTSTIKVGRYSKDANLLKLSNGNWQYIINLESKTGTKREHPILEKLREFKDQISYGEFGEQLALMNGGIETGSDPIIGKKCRVFEFKSKNSRLWLWNWLILKSETLSGKVKINVQATSIQENVSIADSIFKPPLDVLVTEVDLESLRNQHSEDRF
jgi:outer membrane lipoprotein-sorting protein